MTGLEYEKLVAKYLRRHGYFNVSVTKASGDYGVDVIAHKGTHRYAVQCKCYSNEVGLEAVQEAVAGKAMYKCDRAMVVTNATFTKAASELACENNVILLSGIRSAGLGDTATVISCFLLPFLFLLAGLAGMFAAVGETLIKQFQNGQYALAAYNIISIIAVGAVAAAVVFLIGKIRIRKKQK